MDNDNDVEELCSSTRKKGKTVKANGPMTERKYIVYESMLPAFFNVCVVCKSTTNAVIKFVIGSMAALEQNCTLCNFNRVWRSQPYVGSFPAGDIQM